MQWLDRMNQAMDYIEECMNEKIDYEEAARIAQCSEYHFQRMFSYITNVPLAEYIRRRRMTLAAQEIQNTSAKIIDIACKYGYDSPDAFTRAFQKMHGITPSAAREPGVILKAYPRIIYYLTLKGDKEMDYRIVERESFKVFGKVIEVNMNESHEVVPKLWIQFSEDGTKDKLREAAGYGPDNQKNAKLLGAALYDYKEDGTYRYMITAHYPNKTVPSQFEILEIPQMAWAVFSMKCRTMEEFDNIIDIWKRIPEWFQATGYEHASAPELEEYYPTENEFMGEVWIPIIKNK